MDDPEDVFESSLSSLFSQPIIAHSVPTSSSSPYFSFTHPSLPGPSPLLFSLPSAAPASLNSLQAQYIWPSSLFLAHALATGEIELKAGERVCELGAGAGIPGVVAARILEEKDIDGLQADKGWVVSSDWGDEKILEALRENFARNLKSDPRAALHEVLGHEWGSDATPLLRSGAFLTSSSSPLYFSIILCADLLFRTPYHPFLLSSLNNLLPPASLPTSSFPGVVHLAAGLHSGSRGTIDRFVALATSDEWRFEVKDRGISSWDDAKDEWRKVDETTETLGEGKVWRGVLRRAVAVLS